VNTIKKENRISKNLPSFFRSELLKTGFYPVVREIGGSYFIDRLEYQSLCHGMDIIVDDPGFNVLLDGVPEKDRDLS